MIKKEHDYSKILLEMEDENNINIQASVNELIALDVHRTFFEDDIEFNRNVYDNFNSGNFKYT